MFAASSSFTPSHDSFAATFARSEAGVLANARRENESVEAAQRRRERAGEERDPMDEIVDSEGRARIGAGFKLAHIVADAGQAFQAAIMVEQVLDLDERSCPSARCR